MGVTGIRGVYVQGVTFMQEGPEECKPLTRDQANAQDDEIWADIADDLHQAEIAILDTGMKGGVGKMRRAIVDLVRYYKMEGCLSDDDIADKARDRIWSIVHEFQAEADD